MVVGAVAGIGAISGIVDTSGALGIIEGVSIGVVSEGEIVRGAMTGASDSGMFSTGSG